MDIEGIVFTALYIMMAVIALYCLRLAAKATDECDRYRELFRRSARMRCIEALEDKHE